MKILIVDDDYTSRTLLEEILADFGEVDCAVDGTEAVDQFKAALDRDEAYELVLLDVMMPIKSGIDTLDEMRAVEAQYRRIGQDAAKVIMTTALDDSRTILKSFRALCDGYLVKPIHKAKLLEELKRLELVAV